MAEQKPFYLRNLDTENLDLSKYENDYSPEELAAVKQALIATRNEHVSNYEALPLLDKAGIYAQEKFGQAGDYVAENPESLVLAPLAVAGGKAVLDKGRSVFGSLREKMAAPLPNDSLLAEQQRTQAKTPSAPEVPKPVSNQVLKTSFQPGDNLQFNPETLKKFDQLFEEYSKIENSNDPASVKRIEELKTEYVKLQNQAIVPKTGTSIIPTPEVPTVPLNTPVGKAPKEMPMIEQAAGTPEKKAVAEGRKQAAIVPPPSQPSLMTGSGMPAYQGTGPKGAKLSTNIPSLANLPEDKVFVPGGQYMDIIRNATGQEAYTENLKKYGYPVTPQQGYETGRKINESLGRLTREEAKATGAALGEPTKAITEKVNKIKMVKVGGVAGALISLTDLAKADTLRQGLGNVAEGLMPIGIAPSELASGTLTEKQLNAYREAQKLGSPYRSVPPPR